jgi:hypothetical protein
LIHVPVGRRRHRLTKWLATMDSNINPISEVKPYGYDPQRN